LLAYHYEYEEEWLLVVEGDRREAVPEERLADARHVRRDELRERGGVYLALIAEGRSNRAIAKQMYLSARAVERHVQGIFQKLSLPHSEDTNRRVLAVLALLGH
jgi:DNA-binding NarL/FixJ family response regulator